jgi:hypothetical protein
MAVTLNANGTFPTRQTTLRHPSNPFTYTISDGHGGTATATVTILLNQDPGAAWLPASCGLGREQGGLITVSGSDLMVNGVAHCSWCVRSSHLGP